MESYNSEKPSHRRLQTRPREAIHAGKEFEKLITDLFPEVSNSQRIEEFMPALTFETSHFGVTLRCDV